MNTIKGIVHFETIFFFGMF